VPPARSSVARVRCSTPYGAAPGGYRTFRGRVGDPVILLWGQRGDNPIEAVAAQLTQCGAPHVFVGTEARIIRRWSPDAEAVLEAGGVEISLADVTAAYLRPHTGMAASSEEREVAETLLAWADFTRTALVVNRPAAMAPNNSKPFQARLIAQFGLRVPETLVTTDPGLVRAFVQRHREVVYKSVSGIRSIVHRLPRERLDELEDVVTCPTQFQRYISGSDIRVHIVGDEIHALAIQSDRDDYRYAHRDGGGVIATETALEADLAERLRHLAKSMDLILAGVDFRRTPSGELYCLEVNPSPGFTFYESLAGVRLAGRVAAVLARGIC
jgi:glutathione synthase/RimK-type ligase-like ATP-grasp enzyme